MIPKKIYLREAELEEQFMCERMVSCDAPIGSCNLQYTDLSSLWHDASEEPKIGSNIVVINKNDRWWNIRTHDDDYDWPDIKDWICCVRTYDIQKWAYIKDLLPK